MVVEPVLQEGYWVIQKEDDFQILSFQTITLMITSLRKISQTAHQFLSQVSMQRITMVPAGIGGTAIKCLMALWIIQAIGKAIHYP